MQQLSMANPFDAAADAIASLESQFADVSLNLPEFPFVRKPFNAYHAGHTTNTNKLEPTTN